MPTRRAVPGARPEALFQPPPERQPLAARMRPRTLEEFTGQAHLVGERGPLRRAASRGHLASLLLWGPPGTGKTSLARLLAEAVGAEFRTVSAVMSGVADVRAMIAEAQDRLALEQRRSVLFIDEIHRFNKAQQDALLPARRGRHGHAHRGDDREPLLRGQLGAPVADARLAARAACGRGRRAHRPAGTRGRGPRSRRDVRSQGRRRARGRAVRAPGGPRGRRRAPGAQRARGRGRARGGRGPPRRGPRLPHPRRRRGRRAAAGPRVRPRGRRPLRHGERVHQEPAGQRPRRRPVLAGGDDHGRRGPQVHRPAADHQRVRGHRQRGPARTPGRGRGGPGARLRRAPGGAVRARPGDDLPRRRSQVEPQRDRLRRRDGGRHGAGLTARAQPPAQRRRPADEAPRHRRGLPLPPRVRGLGRQAAVPPGRAGGAALLPPLGRGQRASDRRADGRAPGAPRGRQAEAPSRSRRAAA